MQDNSDSTPIKIGISGCLLGEKIRWDTSHKFDPYINGTLARYFSFHPYCPEMGIGLGTPRDPINLYRTDDKVQALVAGSPETDHTVALEDYAKKISPILFELSGFISKSGSPSCGFNSTKVFRLKGGGPPWKNEMGVFMRAIKAIVPHLPLVEEEMLGISASRDSFLERVFAYHHWQKETRKSFSVESLQAFHNRFQYNLLARSPEDRDRLQAIIDDHHSREFGEVKTDYIQQFMEVLSVDVPVKNHTKVFRALLGQLKPFLTSQEKQEIKESLEIYRKGQTPRVVTLALFQHYFKRHPNPEFRDRYYLYPEQKNLLSQFGN